MRFCEFYQIVRYCAGLTELCGSAPAHPYRRPVYSNQKLRTSYGFGRASIKYNTNLIEVDLRWRTNCYYALKPIDQVLIALQFYASGGLLQVVRDSTSPPFHWQSITWMPNQKQSQCLLTENCIMGC